MAVKMVVFLAAALALLAADEGVAGVQYEPIRALQQGPARYASEQGPGP